MNDTGLPNSLKKRIPESRNFVEVEISATGCSPGFWCGLKDVCDLVAEEEEKL